MGRIFIGLLIPFFCGLLQGQSTSCRDIPLTTGSRTSGAVTHGCNARYTFRGLTGQRIAISTDSPGFTPQLRLLDAQSNVIAGNLSKLPADGALLTLPSAGEYTVEVASSDRTATGAFQIELAAACANMTPINFGQTVNGQLSNADCLSDLGNFYTDYYTFTAAAGQRISISMSSLTLDTYLLLNGPTGAVVAENDDVSISSLNSRIPVNGEITLSAAGTYTIQATSYNDLETGTYSLQLQTSGVAPASSGPFRFIPVTPCRLSDTRIGEGTTGAFGPPSFTAGSRRDIPVPAGRCGIPATARAYSLNVTVVPRGVLSFLTIWPAGQGQPLASTLNSFQGSIVANAAVVPAGTNGAVSVFATDATDVIIDINGYFAP